MLTKIISINIKKYILSFSWQDKLTKEQENCKSWYELTEKQKNEAENIYLMSETYGGYIESTSIITLKDKTTILAGEVDYFIKKNI